MIGKPKKALLDAAAEYLKEPPVKDTDNEPDQGINEKRVAVFVEFTKV